MYQVEFRNLKEGYQAKSELKTLLEEIRIMKTF